MLVLTRHADNSDKSVICIGSDITVTVLEIKGDQVRLGVTASKNVSVHRKEIYLQLQDEAKATANTDIAIQEPL